jgi:hypothetical protein
MVDFKAYPKTHRIGTEQYTITEKVDGTNGVVYVHKAKPADFRVGKDRSYVKAGSRSRWLEDDGSKKWDNHGFGEWVMENERALIELPEGFHYGEWYGRGINRNYGLKDRRFMLFDYARYDKLITNNNILGDLIETETVLADVVTYDYLSIAIKLNSACLSVEGSVHVRGFSDPEGLIIRSKLRPAVYKYIIRKDEEEEWTEI